jgi:hypothetical protein
MRTKEEIQAIINEVIVIDSEIRYFHEERKSLMMRIETAAIILRFVQDDNFLANLGNILDGMGGVDELMRRIRKEQIFSNDALDEKYRKNIIRQLSILTTKIDDTINAMNIPIGNVFVL